MSTDRDTTRIVRSWLRADEHESADHVLDAVLDRIDTTPQRRVTWWPARRFSHMNNTAKLALVAAVFVVAALLGYNYFIAPNVGAPVPTPSQAASSQSTSVAVASLPALGLPGARGGSVGEYGWEGRSGSPMGGMHRVVTDGASSREATAIFFAVGPDCIAPSEDRQSTPVRIAGLDAVFVEPYEPAIGFNQVGDEITRAYELSVDGRSLCVFLTWHPTTTEDELESAVAILATLRAQPISEDGIRITFNLPAGWDTG